MSAGYNSEQKPALQESQSPAVNGTCLKKGLLQADSSDRQGRFNAVLKAALLSVSAEINSKDEQAFYQ